MQPISEEDALSLFLGGGSDLPGLTDFQLSIAGADTAYGLATWAGGKQTLVLSTGVLPRLAVASV